MKIKDLLAIIKHCNPEKDIAWVVLEDGENGVEGDIMNVEEYDKTVEICVSYVS